MNDLRIFLIYLVLVLPGLSKTLRDEAISKVVDVAKLFEQLGEFLDKRRIDTLLPVTQGPVIAHAKLEQTLDDIFNSINQSLKTITSSLKQHADKILQRFEKDEDKRPWIIFGFLFQLAFLLLFSYADIIQLLNNVAPLLGSDADKIPPFFQNITVALLMSSIGIPIAAGFIIADFGGLTYFGGWNQLEGGFRKTVLAIVWISFISALAIDVILALGRVRTIPEVAPLLTPEASANILLASAIASTVVILPMLLVTFLFFQGFVGIAILYIIIIHTLALIIELVQMIFVAVVWLFTYGLAYCVSFIVRVFLWILTIALFVVGWTFVAAGTTIISLLELIKSIIDIIYFPIDSVVAWITKRIGLA